MLPSTKGEVHGMKSEGFQDALLQCHVRRTVVPHECGVFIQGIDQRYESIMDERQIVQLDQGRRLEKGLQPGTVKVQVVNCDDNGVCLIELPRETIMGGSRIKVDRQFLTLED